jgi:methylglutaconyl-CoA hydratase
MISELSSAFTALNSRSDIAAVLLRGEGPSFCAGADLAYMKSMVEFSREENETDSAELFDMFFAIRSCPQPVVGLLHGHVMGGGLGLAAVCDIAAAVEGTQFCFSEVKLGLLPAVISPFILEKMAPSYARRFMLSGETFDNQAALNSGLVAFSGEKALAEAFISETLSRLSRGGIEAVRECKKLLGKIALTNDWTKLREITSRAIAERRVSREGQEGILSFLEKRQPKWRST